MSETGLHEKINKFLNSALLKISTNDFDQAIENLKGAEVLDQENPEILFNLGVCYCKKGLYKTAISYFLKIENLPYTFVDVITVLKLLSYSFIMTEDNANAKKFIKRALKLSGKDAAILNMFGYILEKEKKFDAAVRVYKEIIGADNNNFNAYNSIAYILAETNKDLNEALSYAKNALKHSPENPAYLDTIGYIYLKKGHKDMAKKYLKSALAKLPDSKEVRNHINSLLNLTSANTENS